MCRRLLFALLAALSVAVPPAWAGDEGTKLSEDERALFAWWDGLGFPEVGSLPFVRVASANWVQWGDDPKTVIYDHAFLLDSDATTFRVFTSDLRVLHYEKTKPGVAETERIGFEPADLAAFTTAGLETYAKPVKQPLWVEGPDPFLMHRWLTPDQSFRALVLARASAARGHAALAHRLCALALSHHRVWPRPKEPPKDRFALLKEALADEAFVAIVERLSDAAWSHAKLAAAFDRFAQAFPSHENAKRAVRAGLTLGRWTKEPVGDARDDVATRIQRAQRAPCEWWSHRRIDEDEASLRAHKALMTFHAVPRLLQLIGSPDPTRTVLVSWSGKGQYRDWRRAATLGDVATFLLREIAAGALAEDFGDRPKTREAMVAKFRARAVQWWARVQGRGEADVLAERVRSGENGAARAAGRLLAIDAERGIATLAEAVRVATEPYPAAQFVQLLAQRREDAATKALRAVLESRAAPRLRLEAAKGLHARGHARAVLAMVAEWRNPAPQPVQEDVGLPADPGFSRDLVDFLAGSGDVRAYRALSARLGQLSDFWRFHITAYFLVKREDRGERDTPAPGLSAEAAGLVEDLLASRLPDKGEVGGMHMTVGGVSVDLRIGHVAARALAVQFPATYRYDARASSRLRERMRLTAVNTWRGRRGMEPLALPPEPAPPKRVPAAQVLPLVARFEAAATESERAAAQAALVRLGVGAIPALLEAADAAADARQKQDRAALASRQASIVTTVVLTKDSVKPDAKLRQMLDGMRGRPLDGATYVAWMLHATTSMQETATGLRVRAARSDDLRGITVEVTVLGQRHDDGMNGGGWAFGTPGGGYGTSVLRHGRKAEAWKDAGEALDHELSAPARKERVIRFFVVREVDR